MMATAQRNKTGKLTINVKKLVTLSSKPKLTSDAVQINPA